MRLGTRGSALALWQARAVAAAIAQAGGPRCELVVIRTTGDERPASDDRDPTNDPADGQRTTGNGEQDAAVGRTLPGPPMRQPHGGGFTVRRLIADAGVGTDTSVKRLFVKEIEEALLDGRIDAAVHSAKDMPTSGPDELAIGATLPRADPRDALILPRAPAATDDFSTIPPQLGTAAQVGTVSVRRVAQLQPLLPGAQFLALRGNVDTRLRKLDAGVCDVLVLAAAGLDRLGLSHRISHRLSPELCLPAPAQGIVAVEHRRDRTDVAAALATIDHQPTSEQLTAERALVRRLGGGCQLPIAALARAASATDLALIGLVLAPDGSRAIRRHAVGSRRDADGLGQRLGDALLQAGAGAVLDSVRSVPFAEGATGSRG